MDLCVVLEDSEVGSKVCLTMLTDYPDPQKTSESAASTSAPPDHYSATCAKPDAAPTGPAMPPIGWGLDDSQIAALAAYLA